MNQNHVTLFNILLRQCKISIPPNGYLVVFKVKLFIDELSNAVRLNFAQTSLKHLTLEVALDFCINHYNQRLELLRPLLKRLIDEKNPRESTVARLSALINGIEGFMHKVEGLLEPISELDEGDMEDLKLGTALVHM